MASSAETPGSVRQGHLSILGLLSRFRWQVTLTLGLLVIESVLLLLFPLFIGLAVNALIEDSLDGVIALAGLGAAALVIGSGRRLYGARVYAHIHVEIADEVVAREREAGTDVSAVSARSSLLVEMVDFLEYTMPEIIEIVIGAGGALVILATISINVFFASLGLLVLVLVVYGITGRRSLRLNVAYNDELEQEVHALAKADAAGVRRHFNELMRWKIRLSDLGTAHFAVIISGVIVLLFYSPIALVTGDVSAGFVVAALMYVFEYAGALSMVPLVIQPAIRIGEIAKRLDTPAGTESPRV